MTERDDAKAEAEQAVRGDSERIGRPRILVEGTNQDITEEVVSILDALHNSMDWGSGFLTEEEEQAAEGLMILLRFKCGGPVERSEPPSFWHRRGLKSWHGLCVLPYGHDGPHKTVSLDR